LDHAVVLASHLDRGAVEVVGLIYRLPNVQHLRTRRQLAVALDLGTHCRLLGI
jgi:hypothetical protein